MSSSTADRVTGVAPGRVNLIGEHVDYQGGRCLPFALDRRTTTTVTRRDDRTVRVRSGERAWSGSLDDLEQAPSWALYVTGVLLALGVQHGLDLEIGSDVPEGAGLSSSAALECSVAVAVDALLDLGRSPDELVAACITAESDTVGAPTGGLDQTIAVHARAGEALLIDFGAGTTARVPFDPGAHDLSVLVVDTRVSHELTDGGYGSRRDESRAAAARLGVADLTHASATQVASLPEPLARRARHVLSENARVDDFVAALHAGDWSALGPLMDASHASLRDDYEVSCVELDVAVETARAAGAWGARMTGGGFGGSAIALVPTALVDAVRERVTAVFAERGFREPAYLLAEPGAGAHAGPG